MFFQSGPINRGAYSKTLNYLAKKIATNQFRNVITVAGAGISTSAGLIDFRTPGAGLYEHLRKFKLRFGDYLFDQNLFQKYPESLYAILKEYFLSKTLYPTPTHCFIRLLASKGILLSHFTQNIDGLEIKAGVPQEIVVEAHGTLQRSYCVECRAVYDFKWLTNQVKTHFLPRCDKCQGFVRPDIVLFGEPIPANFEYRAFADLPSCDLLIILGTSLSVEPFASMIANIPATCTKLVVCTSPCGEFQNMTVSSVLMEESQDKEMESIKLHDVFISAECDTFVAEFVDMIGWKKDYTKILKEVEMSKKYNNDFEADVGVQTERIPVGETSFEDDNSWERQDSSLQVVSKECSKFKLSNAVTAPRRRKSIDFTQLIFKGTVINPMAAARKPDQVKSESTKFQTGEDVCNKCS